MGSVPDAADDEPEVSCAPRTWPHDASADITMQAIKTAVILFISNNPFPLYIQERGRIINKLTACSRVTPKSINIARTFKIWS